MNGGEDVDGEAPPAAALQREATARSAVSSAAAPSRQQYEQDHGIEREDDGHTEVSALSVDSFVVGMSVKAARDAVPSDVRHLQGEVEVEDDEVTEEEEDEEEDEDEDEEGEGEDDEDEDEEEDDEEEDEPYYSLRCVATVCDWSLACVLDALFALSYCA